MKGYSPNGSACFQLTLTAPPGAGIRTRSSITATIFNNRLLGIDSQRIHLGKNYWISRRNQSMAYTNLRLEWAYFSQTSSNITQSQQNCTRCRRWPVSSLKNSQQQRGSSSDPSAKYLRRDGMFIRTVSNHPRWINVNFSHILLP